MRKQVGEFELEVWNSGYPVWIHIRFENQEFKFHHSSLADLEHLVREAKRCALRALPDRQLEVSISE